MENITDAKLVTWNVDSAGWTGKRGTVTLFTAWRIGGEKPWRLGCTLPGYTAKRWPVSSVEDAQALAEQVMAKWLSLIGATAG
jgi:hypothetical protein